MITYSVTVEYVVNANDKIEAAEKVLRQIRLGYVTAVEQTATSGELAQWLSMGNIKPV